MKNYLHTLPYFLIFLLLAGVQPKSYSQCSCPDGEPVNTITHTQSVDSITAITTAIDFPKFDPSLGTLYCFQLASTVTTVTNLHLYNFESSNRIYQLESFRRSQFTGPGGFFASITSPTKSYGPYDLAPADPLGTDDEVHIGPDTMFNSRYTSTNFNSSLSQYMGSGNVSFTYLNTSTTTLTQGSSNMDLVVRGYTRLSATITYNWCPNALLATNIKNFVAYKKDGLFQLKWVTENKVPGMKYEIQFSGNGTNFTRIGQIDAKDIFGNTMQHEFQYAAMNSAYNKIYFRIKQIDAQGNVSYSPVRIVNTIESSAAEFIVYPNPVSRKVAMQFDRNLNGNYVIEVTSLSGQVIYSKKVQLHNNTNLQFEFNNPPASGIYYLKITDSKSKLSNSSKLIIQR
jgi:hypothetical protein